MTRPTGSRRLPLIPHSRPWVLPQDARAVSISIKSRALSPSPAVEGFEVAVARTLGTSQAVAVSSGTAALYLTLKALNIGPGDDVLFPSYVCSALRHAVTAVGATPRLVEVDPHTFNIEADHARRRLTRRTKALIVPHLFGLPADLDELLALGPPLIEDCAQTMGVSYHDRPVGSFGIASICSFYATKLITAGEGGMVASSSAALIGRVRSGRSCDEQPRWSPSFNFKLSGLEAALGESQLKRLPTILARRRRIASLYRRALDQSALALPRALQDRGHAHYRYVVKVPGGSDQLMATLSARGITCRRPVFRPLHRDVRQGRFPMTDQVWRESMSLPIYPDLSQREVRRVIGALRWALSRTPRTRRRAAR